jgi:glucose/arabinose dehydrogenase
MRISRTLNLPKNRITRKFPAAILTAGLLLAGCSLGPLAEPTVVNQPPIEVSPTTAAPTEPLPPTSDLTPEPTNPPAPTENRKVIEFPDSAAYQLNVLVSGLDRPLFLTHAGDGSGRIFIVEKPGRIVIYRDGALQQEAFLDIVARVSSQESERGLLGLAFHPDFETNGLFFVNYTDRSGDTVISRFSLSDNPVLADPNSEEILLVIGQPYANHNGGMLAFGPDGYLYIGMGDGGSAGDPQGNAQNSESLLGKILRIDVDSGSPYAIPAGNAPASLPEIWALGVRNPWRFSFDRASGDLWIGDVGQNQWEEIHVLPAGVEGGQNLGWDYFEGTHPFEGSPPAGLELVPPVIEYNHSGGHCSVTGGYVYRGSQPEWQGIYLYGDYCSGIIWGALAGPGGDWQTMRLYETSSGLASFGEDQDGELYALYLNGSVYRMLMP